MRIAPAATLVGALNEPAFKQYVAHFHVILRPPVAKNSGGMHGVGDDGEILLAGAVAKLEQDQQGDGVWLIGQGVEFPDGRATFFL